MLPRTELNRSEPRLNMSWLADRCQNPALTPRGKNNFLEKSNLMGNYLTSWQSPQFGMPVATAFAGTLTHPSPMLYTGSPSHHVGIIFYYLYTLNKIQFTRVRVFVGVRRQVFPARRRAPPSNNAGQESWTMSIVNWTNTSGGHWSRSGESRRRTTP